MTGKQRAFLRARANKIQSKYQVGKGGIEESFINQINDALEANELIKITVLDNAFTSAREVCDAICERVGAHPVQVIGNKLVIYRPSTKNKKIELPD